MEKRTIEKVLKWIAITMWLIETKVGRLIGI